MHRPLLFLALGAAGALAPLAIPDPAEERYCYTQWEDNSVIDNGTYDGRFTFFRVRFEPSFGGGGRGFGRRGVDKKWDHDTPRAERHLMKILEEITTLRPQMNCGAIFAFGEPESFKYPIAYVSEPGFWTMDQEELTGIREYVAKGGFIIFDDFYAEHWYNFEERWRQAFPDLQLQPLDRSHSLFDAFYDIRNTQIFSSGGGNRGSRAEWYGAFEDNDPTKRLVAIANYNADLGELMEFSDEGFVSIDLSNEAYKIMVNYMIYAMTH
jgi:Domain of unknown function (DUF4159)